MPGLSWDDIELPAVNGRVLGKKDLRSGGMDKLIAPQQLATIEGSAA